MCACKNEILSFHSLFDFDIHINSIRYVVRGSTYSVCSAADSNAEWFVLQFISLYSYSYKASEQ